MKKLLYTFAILTTTLLSQPLLAQSPTPSTWQNQAENATDDAVESRQTDTSNFGHLTAAITNYYTANSYIHKSVLGLKADFPSGQMNLKFNIHSIMQADGKFRTVVSSGDTPSPQAYSLIIVSDGNSVWSYRTDLNQYSIQTYQKFMANNQNWFALGLSTSAFLKIPMSYRLPIAQGILNHPSATKAFIDGMQTEGTIVSRPPEPNGSDFYRYELEPKKFSGSRIRLEVDPQSQTFKGIQLLGQYEGKNFEITETLQTREPVTSANDQAFQFVIPAKAQKVPSVSLF
jgi:outer membrane lipoprotein-sorting protein